MIKTKEVKFDTVANSLTLLSVSLFFILMFAVKRGHSIGAILIALIAIIVIPILLDYRQSFNLTKVDKNLLIMFAVYGFILIAINWWHMNPMKEYGNAIKFLLAIPIFLLLYTYPIKPIWFFILLILATLIGAGVGYYNHTHYSWASRATVKGVNTILYASVIQVLAFSCLIGLPLVKNISHKVLKYLYVILSISAFVAGIFVSVLSYSRGVWLVFPFQLLLVAIFYFKHNKKTVISFTLILAVLMVSAYFSPQTGVKKRIDKTFSSLAKYQKGNADTSTGKRLEMYKFAITLAKDKPILGTPAKEIKARQKRIPEINYWALMHFHNHYLQNLAYYGIIGVILLLGVYVFSFIAFWKRFKMPDVSARSLGYVGIMLLVSYLLYSVTDLVFHRNIGLLFYVVVTTTICGAVKPNVQDC